jgi:hypothetical protein
VSGKFRRRPRFDAFHLFVVLAVVAIAGWMAVGIFADMVVAR